jgi:predicted kinase
VVRAARELAKDHLRARRSFVWNATNVTRRLRTPLVELFAAYGARVRIVYVEPPLDDLRARNRRRRDAVPGEVIERLLDKLDFPDITEAHAVEHVVDQRVDPCTGGAHGV